jgi:hypothetical protein
MLVLAESLSNILVPVGQLLLHQIELGSEVWDLLIFNLGLGRGDCRLVVGMVVCASAMAGGGYLGRLSVGGVFVTAPAQEAASFGGVFAVHGRAVALLLVTPLRVLNQGFASGLLLSLSGGTQSSVELVGVLGVGVDHGGHVLGGNDSLAGHLLLVPHIPVVPALIPLFRPHPQVHYHLLLLVVH